MREKIFLTLLLISCISPSLLAQQPVGKWSVVEVKIGSKHRTPQARWTTISRDGTYQSGNGWLQNAEGRWTYDNKKKLLSFKETNGLIDEFGPFTVEFTTDGMRWLREEEGMIVEVTLEKIEKRPKGPADLVVGLWELETETEVAKQLLFIRWDRIYINRSKTGRFTGYWHMHGHKPELTFLPHSNNEKVESWRMEASEKRLKLIGVSDSNKDQERIFIRRYQFPN